MDSPFIISILFVLSIIALCFWKPNIGRIFLGFFFLAMALGVNGYFTFNSPQAYLEYASGALIPLYRDLAVAVVRINPFLFGLLVMAFEISMAALILHKKNFVRYGLAGTMAFIIGIAPLSWLQLPWLGLLVAQGYLFSIDFEQSVLEALGSKIGLVKPQFG